jgi:hypothetical protein
MRPRRTPQQVADQSDRNSTGAQSILPDAFKWQIAQSAFPRLTPKQTYRRHTKIVENDPPPSLFVTRTWTGHIRDTVVFSILDSEWPTVKLRLEQRLAKLTG